MVFTNSLSSYYEKMLATGEVKCIDEEIPFEIPQGWEWCRLHDIIIFIGGYAYDSHSFLEKSEYQVLRLGNIKNDAINKSVNPVFIDEILAQNTVRFRCLKNDILVTMTGTRKKRDYFYTVLIDTDHSNMYFNQRVGCLRAIYSPIALWLNKVLKAESILHQVFQYETGTANQGNLGATNIMNTLIPLPPVTEQSRIVRRLEEVHTYVFQYDKAQHELDILNSDIKNTIKKSIVQEAIQGKLVPQIAEEGTAEELLEQIKAEKLKLVKEGKLKKSALNDSVIFRGDDNKYWEKSEDGAVCIDEEIPFEIPSNWAWVRLDDICSFIHRGKSPKYSPIKKYPVVAQKCNQWDGFSIEKAKFIEPQSISSYNEEYFLQDRDLMWNSTGLGTLGRMAIYYKILNPYELAVADSHVTVIRPYKTHIVSEYLYYYFASNTVQSVIEDKSDGSTKQKELATKTVKAYLVPIPPFAEQQRIVQKIKSVTSTSRRLVKLKKTLLTRYHLKYLILGHG